MDEKWYTVKEVAGILGKQPETIRDWCKDGKFQGAIKDPGGQWSIPQSAIDNRGKVSEPKAEEPKEAQAVLDAKEQAAIAKATREAAEDEEKTAKAEREKEIAQLGMTPEQYKMAVENVQEVAKKYQIESASLTELGEAMGKERVVWSEKVEGEKERADTAEDRVRILVEEVKRNRLEKAETQRREDEAQATEAHYKAHIKEGIVILKKTADGIESWSPKLEAKLNLRIASLDGGKTGYELGIDIIQSCFDAIITEASFFQDNEFKGLPRDAGDKVAEWLFNRADELEVTMKLEYGKPEYNPDLSEAENAKQLDGFRAMVEQSKRRRQSSPSFAPPASSGVGLVLDRFGSWLDGVFGKKIDLDRR